MLYIRLTEEDSHDLVFYCRNCGNSEELINKDNICVSKTDILIKEKAYYHDINEYTKLDPTLPRTNNIKCPNQLCPSNITIDEPGPSTIEENTNKNEVIYLRYDDINMKYIYICTQCDKIWKTNDN
jgi:DNA-directed RNA polymerase subunit M/transcription elongation factor TFIIS